MKTYIRTNGQTVIDVLDPRDERYGHIIANIDLDGFVQADITSAQLDQYNEGAAFDYVGGKIVPHQPTPEELAAALAEARRTKSAEIDAYDRSPAVNSFQIGGAPMWLDRDTRTSLSRTIALEAATGKTHSTIWYNEAEPPVCFDLPIPAMEAMLAALEVYAKDAFNVTQSHKAVLYELATVAEVEAYDHTAGYPERLIFTL